MELKQFKQQCKLCYYHKNNFCSRFGKPINDLHKTVRVIEIARKTKVCIGFLREEFARPFVDRCSTCGHIQEKGNAAHYFCFFHEDHIEDIVRTKINRRTNIAKRKGKKKIYMKNIKCNQYIENTEARILAKKW